MSPTGRGTGPQGTSLLLRPRKGSQRSSCASGRERGTTHGVSGGPGRFGNGRTYVGFTYMPTAWRKDEGLNFQEDPRECGRFRAQRDLQPPACALGTPDAGQPASEMVGCVCEHTCDSRVWGVSVNTRVRL